MIIYGEICLSYIIIQDQQLPWAKCLRSHDSSQYYMLLFNFILWASLHVTIPMTKLVLPYTLGQSLWYVCQAKVTWLITWSLTTPAAQGLNHDWSRDHTCCSGLLLGHMTPHVTTAVTLLRCVCQFWSNIVEPSGVFLILWFNLFLRNLKIPFKSYDFAQDWHTFIFDVIHKNFECRFQSF